MFKKIIASLLSFALLPIAFAAYNPPNPTTINALSKYSDTHGSQANTGVTLDNSNNLLTPGNISLSLGNILLSGISASVTAPLFIASTSLSVPSIITASGNLSINPAGGSTNFNSTNIIGVGDFTASAVFAGGLNCTTNNCVISPLNPGGIINLNHSFLVGTLLRMNSGSYNIGSMTQSGHVISGAGGTNWSFSMVGGTITTVPGGVTATILEVAGTNTLIVDTNLNLSSTSYIIYYNGIQSSEASGALGVTQLLANTSITTPTITTNGTDLTLNPAIDVHINSTKNLYVGSIRPEVGEELNLTDPANPTNVNFGGSSILDVQDAQFTVNISVPLILADEIDNVSQNGPVSFRHGVKAWRPIVTHSSDYTLALTDANTLQDCTKSTTQIITVPTNASVAFPIGTEIDFVQDGAGQLSFSAAGGVTINSVLGNLKTANQFGTVTFKKMGTNTWLLIGALVAANDSFFEQYKMVA